MYCNQYRQFALAYHTTPNRAIDWDFKVLFLRYKEHILRGFQQKNQYYPKV